jgi:apolipoprotein N-acyltransferase
MKSWVLVLSAVASAFCTVLSTEPVGSGFAAIAAPLFLILIAMHAKSTRIALLIIFITQIPVWMFLHAWVSEVSFVGWIGLSLYMSIWATLFVWLLRKIILIESISLVISAPTLWVGLECLRGIIIFEGYPWYLSGTGIVDWPMAMIASVGGVWLASFLVVSISAALANITKVKWWTFAILILVITVTSMCHFGDYILELDRKRIEVAVVQTNVPQSRKISWTWERQVEDISKSIQFTYEAMEKEEVQPSLVVWPETMVLGSGFETNRFDFAPWDEDYTELWIWAESVRIVAKEINTPILVGSQTWINIDITEGSDYLKVDPQQKFNSAVLVHPDGTTHRYDKLFLTPFGERIPYLEYFPALKNWVRKKIGIEMLFDLQAGETTTRFTLPAENLDGDATEITFATPICFEDTVPRIVRKLVWEDGERKAGVLINLSNDGWLGSDKSAHLQHVREARMRCIENRTPMLRSANTGVSCYINSSGKVIKELPILENGILTTMVDSGVQRPLSRFIGDSVAWLCLIGSILLVLGSSMKRSIEQDEITS